MESAVSSAPVYRFGLFEADAARHTLTRRGVRVKLPDQSFHVLILLLAKPGEIVTREELRQTLWPEGTYVDFDGSLNVVLKRLRSAIDDDSDNPRFIETVPRRGYRFIAPVSIDPLAPAFEAPKSQAELGTPESRSSLVSPKTRLRVMLALTALVLLFAGWGGWYLLRYHSVVQAAPKIIAVLPFSNEGAGTDYDYLRYAIANDLVTNLTYARFVSVRPFASTIKYTAQPSDPVAIGRELRASHVLEGGFLRDQQNLRVNLELVEVGQNQVVWRDEITVGPQELIALHDKLAASTSRGLFPAMKIADAATGEIPRPKNEEAFDLFLHAVTVSLDPEPNRVAIKKLEQSVSLDSQYAPAWGELGWRYYLDYHNGGDRGAKAKCLQAFRRQAELDPNEGGWITIRVEQGDLDGAYDEVARALQRRPDFSGAHFGMSYVLRYAGLLEEAGKECDAAFALDPVNGYRSCATTFILAGDYSHAQKYINLDKSSGTAALMRMHIALRMRNTSAALAEANTAAQLGYRNAEARFAQVCLSHPREAELGQAVAEMEADPVSSYDSELLYLNAGVLSLCGQADAALRQLRKAIQGNYCSYPAMDKDPLFDSVRQFAGFAELRQAAIQCQQSFLDHRKQVTATLQAAHP